jgi:ABC-2 type transport system ATP-binding protein
MLEVKQLVKFYGQHKAVDRVNFTIDQGEIVGLLGQNGAGKTTIMKMLSGFLEPDEGEVVFNGLSLADHTKLIQQSIGYLPENLPVYPEMTVADYLDYAAELKGLGDNKYHEIKRVIEATALEDKLDAPINTLSRGYKQRVGVAQAVLGQPKLLILDEPTNGLDPTQTAHMRELIKQVAKTATVILSTHIMQEVDALCERVLIIRNGQLALDAKLDELRNSNHLTLHTSLAPDVIGKLLADMTPALTIKQQQQVAEHYQYQLQYQQQLDQNQVALIAERVIEAKGKLYALMPLQRNLETVFKEIYQQGTLSEVQHGA